MYYFYLSHKKLQLLFVNRRVIGGSSIDFNYLLVVFGFIFPRQSEISAMALFRALKIIANEVINH